ncbi:DUF1932 domain-containing protein [uncultured Aliiroseovarius sp.]|uniref:NAD(P)-dependent oxidoreductase n=1 Tax=uncultured Aliiroseovarius sp. TaxID=1658783 RepID=UPI0025949AFE|nr:DUF1932 domain-containing protein [uncultured Aliiroseovarius sp.]
MRLGFMGFGEAAFHMAAGLVKEGLDRIVVYDHAMTLAEDAAPRQTLMRRVADAGVTLVDGPAALAAGADFIVLAVPATFAEGAATAITEHMGAGQTLADVCSSSPNLKAQIAESCAARGLGYVDSPMLGPLPVYGHKVPIAASGAAAQAWHDAMTPFNMVIEVIDGPAGMASRIKLSRSLFTKGFEALLVETFQFARKNGVEDVVMNSIGETMDRVSFRQSAERYLAGDLVHAARRAHELEDAITIMRETGIEPLVAQGAHKRLMESANSGSAEKLGGEMPKSLEDVFAMWRETGAI